MEMLSLSKLKTQASARAAEQDRIDTRKRNLLVLILSHLSTFGYTESCEKLQLESGVSLSKVTVADNMDLLGIMQEFESFFQIKFGKPPKFVRKLSGSDMKPNKSSGSNSIQRFDHDEAHQSHSSTALNEVMKKCDPFTISLGVAAPSFIKSSSSTMKNRPSSNANKAVAENKPLPPISYNALGTAGSNPTTTSTNTATPNSSSNQHLIEAVGTKTGHASQHQASTQQQTAPAAEPAIQDPDTRLLKPLPFFASSELRDLAHLIQRDIFTQNPNVKWSDIAGLETSKRLIKEAIVFPIKFPQLFTGLLKPWKGILLYGPPGTGKTMLAKAVATECNTTFFNISASSVVSKWRGDSEKLIRVLFELARYHAPSTIFLDELESIMSHRGGAGGDAGEHEGSRRMKTELLIQMDGLSKSEDHVFLLAASNLPWDLDLAMLRRLEKRILIDVPDFDARQHLFTKLLTLGNSEDASKGSNLDFADLARRTKGYSGSDINLVCREAAMRPLRSLFDKLDKCSNQEELAAESKEGIEEWEKVLAVSQDDVLEAIKTTKSSSDESIRKKYDDWQKSFGSV